jgi:hypothetical protein
MNRETVAFILLSGGIGCPASPPSELRALSDESTCTTDEDCCAVVDTCSATVFGVDRTQVDAAAAIIAAPALESCARCFTEIPTPVCRTGVCNLIPGGGDEQPSLESIGSAQCSTGPSGLPEDLGQKSIGCGGES